MPGGYIGALEVINWAWTVLRLYEEIKQATKQSVQAYINADNVVDLLTYTMIMAVAVMRLLVFFDCRGPPSELWANRDPAMDAGYWNVFYDNPDRMKLLYYSCPVAPGPNGNGWLGLGDETWWWARMYGRRYDLLKSSAEIYALAAILSYWRLLAMLGVSESVGVLKIIMVQMIKRDVISWFMLTSLITVGFSVAFQILEPANILNPASARRRALARVVGPPGRR